jgi:hypothetical protein
MRCSPDSLLHVTISQSGRWKTSWGISYSSAKWVEETTSQIYLSTEDDFEWPPTCQSFNSAERKMNRLCMHATYPYFEKATSSRAWATTRNSAHHLRLLTRQIECVLGGYWPRTERTSSNNNDIKKRNWFNGTRKKEWGISYVFLLKIASFTKWSGCYHLPGDWFLEVFSAGQVIISSEACLPGWLTLTSLQFTPILHCCFELTNWFFK